MKKLAIFLLISTPALAKVSFVRDVKPILNKVGCTQGTCHGAAKGKNGFKLSLRGYDPEYDYRALINDLSGRRFNRTEPARSLMLLKPTAQVPHGGGLRLEIGSAYYNTILQWISEGDGVRRSGFGDRNQARSHAARDPAARSRAASSNSRSRRATPTAPRATSPRRPYTPATPPPSPKWTKPAWSSPCARAKPRCWCATKASSPSST